MSSPDWKTTALVSLHGVSLSPHDLLVRLHQRGRLLPLLRETVVEEFLVRQGKQAGLAVSDEELQQAADRFRHRHGLTTAEQTRQWLARESLTVDAFEVGARVKIAGVTKGKGFQGTIKRHNFASGPKSHGSHNVRAPGSIGASATPARVMKGIRGPGQMGNKRATQKGLEIVSVDAGQNLLLVRGSVPGPTGGIVEVRSDA